MARARGPAVHGLSAQAQEGAAPAVKKSFRRAVDKGKPLRPGCAARRHKKSRHQAC